MQGLKEYIDKYGKHLTLDLVKDTTKLKWNVSQVIDSAQKKVYYNTTRATLGDMVFLTNKAYNDDKFNKKTCINYMLRVIGNVDKESIAFYIWLSYIPKNFDFYKYI